MPLAGRPDPWVPVVVVGGLFAFLAALGVLRFPDLYTRMHAASKAGTVSPGPI